MQQFLIIVAAHFLALISPGPDFFLVARTSIAAGWKRATGVCLGIALANGVFIVAAFGGVSGQISSMVGFQPKRKRHQLSAREGHEYALQLGVASSVTKALQEALTRPTKETAATIGRP